MHIPDVLPTIKDLEECTSGYEERKARQEKKNQLDQMMGKIRSRYGQDSVRKGMLVHVKE